MSLILHEIIENVLSQHSDANLESKHARKVIAEEITDIYYMSSNDFISIIKSREEEHVQSNK